MILRVDACPLHCFYVFLLFPRLAWNDATVGISNKKNHGTLNPQSSCWGSCKVKTTHIPYICCKRSCVRKVKRLSKSSSVPNCASFAALVMTHQVGQYSWTKRNLDPHPSQPDSTLCPLPIRICGHAASKRNDVWFCCRLYTWEVLASSSQSNRRRWQDCFVESEC